MTFKENLRLEQIYFMKLKDIVSDLTAWKVPESDKKTLDILNSCIAADEAILLLYKNIGEAWNDLASQIVAEKGALEAIKAELESFKDEINAKVDDVNNYLNNVIAGIEARVAGLEVRMTDVENDLRTMHRVKVYRMVTEGSTRTIYDGSEIATTDDMIEKLNGNYAIFVRTDASSNIWFSVSAYSSSAVQFLYTAFNPTANSISLIGFRYSSDAVSLYSSKTYNLGDIATNKTNITALENAETITSRTVTISTLDWQVISGFSGRCALIGPATDGFHFLSPNDYFQVDIYRSKNMFFFKYGNNLYIRSDDQAGITLNYSFKPYLEGTTGTKLCNIITGF